MSPKFFSAISKEGIFYQKLFLFLLSALMNQKRNSRRNDHGHDYCNKNAAVKTACYKDGGWSVRAADHSDRCGVLPLHE